MITLSKSGNSVTFTFENNGHYLMNGTIDVPVNGLILVTDESEMATFKKLDGDPFISCLYSDLGMTKAELISWYEENMVGSTGISEEEVEAMISADTVNYFDGAEYDSENKVINFLHGDTVKAYIDASDFVVDGMIDDVSIETISGETYLVIDFNTASGKEDILIPLSDIFDADNYYTKDEVDAVISAATTDMATQTWVGQQGYITGVDLSDYATQEYVTGAVSGKADSSRVDTIEEVTARALVNLDDKKLDASAYTPTDLSEYWTSAQTDNAISSAVSGKQDTLSAGTGISISGNVISSDAAGAEGVTQAEYDAMVQAGTVDPDKLYIITDAQPIDMSDYYTSAQTQSAITAAVSGKQDTLSAGRGIAIDTGNTISSTLYIYNGNATGAVFLGSQNNSAFGSGYTDSLRSGYNSKATGQESICFSSNSQSKGLASAIVGGRTNNINGGYSFIGGGNGLTTNNNNETAFGSINISRTGNSTSAQTLFSIGDGEVGNPHNALEIRKNGDIYCNNGTADIKLQDYLQIKVMAISQADYDALVQGGTVDANTLYVINNVV